MRQQPIEQSPERHHRYTRTALNSRRFKPEVLLVFRGRSQKLLYFLAFPRRTLSYPADVKVVAMPALRIVQGGEAAFGRHYIDSNSCIWSGAANVPMLD